MSTKFKGIISQAWLTDMDISTQTEAYVSVQLIRKTVIYVTNSLVQFITFIFMLSQAICWADIIYLIDQLVLLNSPFSFELTGLYMDLIHGATTT